MNERKEYAYILCVGRELNSVIARGWWSTEREMMHEKVGMSAAALHFRKSAAILVYEKKGEKWRFASSAEASPYLCVPQEITISPDNRIL